MWIAVLKYFFIILLVGALGSDCPGNWFDCGNGKCITAVWFCDGDNDCGNLKDERDCETSPSQVICRSSQFECESDKHCIPERWRCDGENDCDDRSDEIRCDNVAEECAGFVCHNHHCIPAKLHCDGREDCTDGSDEEMCFESKLCKESDFACASGSCINQSLVCDKKKDCVDGSDEGFLCDDSCENITCSQNCKSTPAGPQCYCNYGYLLDTKDNSTCLDIDECLQEGFCSHQCTNTAGSYICSCQSGYELVGRTCKARGPEPLLMFTTLQEIHAVRLRSKQHLLVRKANYTASSVDVDPKSQQIYWVEISNILPYPSIYTAKADGSRFTTILNHGLFVPEDIAVDYVANNLYLTDSGLQQVLACKMDGTMCSVLHDKNVEKPHSIILDPAEGLMYWSDWGEQTSGIYRSGMDGSRRISLVSIGIAWPNGIAIDHSTNRLYWADAKLNTIEYISLDGSSRKVILNATEFHPYSLVVFEDTIYWSDWLTLSLESCNKFTGHKITLLASENGRRIMDVHIYHPVLTATVSNPCWSNNCSHMCLISPTSGFSCACPQGYQLGRDGKTCASNRCAGDDFQCKNGHCILKSWRCDRRYDCPDNSDEEDCPVTECSKGEMACLNGKCIAVLWRCDGERDCADGSDEVNCNVTRCGSDHYRCDSGQCIPLSWVCDKSNDCTDSSDEKNCNRTMCEIEELPCPSVNRCISRRWICDGDLDCPGGSDEDNCEESKMHIQQLTQTSQSIACDNFYCNETGQCLPWSKVCDGHQDCKDLADEGGLCSTACSDDNGGCSDVCKKTPYGSQCLCHKGYRLLPDNKTCDDIYECLAPGTCSHYCYNTKGGFKCSCAEGYILHDYRLCKVNGGSANLVYLAGDKIMGFDLLSHNQRVIIDWKDVGMEGMDYDASTGVFFWTENAGHIKTYSPDPRKGDIIILPTLRPACIRYDWITKNLYLKDESSSIIACAKDGTFCKTLIKSDRIRIDSMDISPTAGFMFWTVWANIELNLYSGLIERAEMDGTHRLVIVSEKTISPTAITVDHVLRMLYWSDEQLDIIECADFYGFTRRQIIQSGRYQPLAVAVFEDNIYFADRGSDSIIRCNKFTGQEDCERIIENGIKAHILSIVHKAIKPQGINRCLDTNCSHLCLLTRTSSVCACHENDGTCGFTPISPVPSPLDGRIFSSK